MDVFSWIYLGIILVSLVAARLAGRLLPLAFAVGGAVGLALSFTALAFYYGLAAAALISAAAAVLIPRIFGRRLTPLEGMVGKACTVTERILPLTGGQVSVEGGLWAARSLSGDAAYEVGAHLTVVAIEGVKVIVG